MRAMISALVLGVGFAGAAAAGDFSTSGVTYQTPDFTTAGGTRTVSAFDSAFVRFPLVSGAEYTISFASTNGTGYAMAIHDFVAAESPSGDPFNYPGGAGVIASYGSFTTTGSTTFTAATDGFGTIELADFTSSPVAATITMVSSISQVPLPAAGALLLGGLAAFGALRRRKAPKAA